ncbi:WD40 repeat domain-containing serine/threonine protein kinase [Synoicihabitans lomoniglobus]|uniref:WD40 repeat domain-containing serine/threonine protein kinase n=1 Tax=Synoicihabitans lomoniglobus TaxID=2909285 RepID=A0AAE9ZWN5_9BACT|nr:WD40 repeat domain-containing serine/threonine protein kinase [Opitutaceae bacterium LMO-M01]WED64569.1 WD40 repeat domain-containing serine/threonine protein kinase [Opitutaceae bacterium LMO-M01]
MTTSSDSTPVPPRIPDYELLRLIGAGSYGDVWIARTATGVYRAVKVVWRNRFEDEVPYEREFRGLREFERVSLVGPRQLALLHVARRDQDGFFYYVMELADDAATGAEIDPATYRPLTLREVRREGELSVKRVLELGVEMARGLAVLHEHGLVHRDIKPSNIIMVSGVPKLADIGLVASATMALTFVGTEGFVAPEGPGAPAADVYAMGKVLYELATGLDRNEFPQLPEAFSQREDRMAFLELNAVILRACEPDLKRRPEDARALLDDLLLVQAGKSVRRLWAAERGLARALKMVAVLAAVAAVAGAGAWIAWDRAQQEMALRAEAEAERDALARKTQYAGLLAQASRALDKHVYGSSRHLLALAEQTRNSVAADFEWRVLRRRANGDVAHFYRDQGPAIVRIELSADEAALAVLDTTGVITAYSPQTGEIMRRFESASDTAGFSHNGDWLWGVDGEANPCRWSWEGDSFESTPGPGSNLWALGLDPRERWLGVERSYPGRLLRWDGTPGGELEVLKTLFPNGAATDWEAFRIAAGSDNEDLAIAWLRGQGGEAEFVMTTMVEGMLKWSIPPVRPGSMGWIATTGKETRLEVVDDLSGKRAWYNPVTSKWDKFDTLLPPKSGRRWSITHDAGVGSARVVGAGLLMDEDGHSRILWGQAGLLTSVAVSSDGVLAYSGSQAGDVVRWNLGAGIAESPRISAGLASLRLAWTRDSRYLLAPDENGVRGFDRGSMSSQFQWPEMRWAAGSFHGVGWGVSADGAALVGIEELTGLVQAEIGRAETTIVAVALAARTGRVVLTRGDGSMWTGSVETQIRRVVDTGYRWALTVDDEGTRVWSTGRDLQIHCQDLETGEELWATPMPVVSSSLCLLPRFGQLAVATVNGNLHILDAHSGERNAIVPTGTAAAEDVRTSPDGSRLFVAGNDGDIQVLEVGSWIHFAALGLHSGQPTQMLAIAPDGRALAAISKSGHLDILQ